MQGVHRSVRAAPQQLWPMIGRYSATVLHIQALHTNQNANSGQPSSPYELYVSATQLAGKLYAATSIYRTVGQSHGTAATSQLCMCHGARGSASQSTTPKTALSALVPITTPFSFGVEDYISSPHHTHVRVCLLYPSCNEILTPAPQRFAASRFLCRFTHSHLCSHPSTGCHHLASYRRCCVHPSG